jgi:hypothetical protein
MSMLLKEIKIPQKDDSRKIDFVVFFGGNR